MLAAILTVTGPIVDRIFFISLGITQIGPLPAEVISFLIMDGILAALLLYDYRGGRTTTPLTVALTIYLAAQLGYFLIQKSWLWYAIAAFLLQVE